MGTFIATGETQGFGVMYVPQMARLLGESSFPTEKKQYRKYVHILLI